MTTVVCVASGPSATADQFAQVTAAQAAGKCRVLVVNNNWEYVPSADVLYAADAKWWTHYGPRVLAEFRGECWTCDADTARKLGLCFVKVIPAPGLSRDPAVLHSGQNGGYQLIGLAYKFGATRIVLIGYDMQHTDGKAHHHADHTAPMSNAAGVKSWAPQFVQLHADLLAEGVALINCSIATALTIPRGDLAIELERGAVRGLSQPAEDGSSPVPFYPSQDYTVP